jgi:hypothetical protein
MKAYADTGFVVSLYKVESTSVEAAAAMGRLQAPVWLSPLGELELHNAFQFAIFRGEIDATSALRKKQLFAEDLAKGIFFIQPVPAAELYSRKPSNSPNATAPFSASAVWNSCMFPRR